MDMEQVGVGGSVKTWFKGTRRTSHLEPVTPPHVKVLPRQREELSEEYRTHPEILRCLRNAIFKDRIKENRKEDRCYKRKVKC